DLRQLGAQRVLRGRPSADMSMRACLVLRLQRGLRGRKRSEEQTLGEAGVLMTGGLGVARLNGVSLKWLGVEIKYPAQQKRTKVSCNECVACAACAARWV